MMKLATASILLSLVSIAQADTVTVDRSIADRSKIASTADVRDDEGNTFHRRANHASCFEQRSIVRMATPFSGVPVFDLFVQGAERVDSSAHTRTQTVPREGVVESSTYDASYSTRTSWTVRVVARPPMR